MSEHELLRKLKAYSTTYVVHSNANPNAAVAAMALMLGRSQEAGPYFQLSETFIPTIDGLAAIEVNDQTGKDPITADFTNDWVQFLRDTGLPGCGLTYDDARTPHENTMRFLNANNRRIPSLKPRAVHESRGLVIPVSYRQDYESLVALIRDGGDLKPYLSRDILKKGRPDKNDGLLNAWGIQHLHFRPTGTDQLMFCMITDTDVFMIQTLPHNEKNLWVDRQLLQIMHDNWPEQIVKGKVNGLSRENHPTDKSATLRGLNANFLTTMDDGTIYLAPGGGMMASGDSQEDKMNCVKIFAELPYWQNTIMDSATEIRAALGLPTSRKLVFRMAFDNRVCCFYEATVGVRLALKLHLL
jgi:hypothetical protein